MSWRLTQLQGESCTQDSLILDLFQDTDVKYVGYDNEFKSTLNINENSSNLIMVVNETVWYSELIQMFKENLKLPTETFYIGINRYNIIGNDTTETLISTGQQGLDIINSIKNTISKLGYEVIKSGYYDKDRGRHFNFVQPLTWIYGHKRNTGN